MNIVETEDYATLLAARSNDAKQAVAALAARENGDSLRPVVELTMDDLGGNAADDGYVTKADDWTLSADERRTSGERQQRAEDALLTTTGELWWAKMSPSGFGPVALEELGGTAQVAYDGTEVITTIDAIDADDVRVDAGFVKAESFGITYKVDGLYRDFVSAARVFAADDEQGDLWTDEGYNWEQLNTDNELAVSGPSFTAYWE